MPRKPQTPPDALAPEDGTLFHDAKGRPVPLPRPLAPLADTHGHLTHFRTHDASVALCRAALAGVCLLVVPIDPADDMEGDATWGTSVGALLGWLDDQVERACGCMGECAAHGLVPPEFPGFADVPDLLGNVRIVAGAHPYGARRYLEDASVRARLEELMASPRCVGVGEIGLDYGPYNELPRDVQLAAFRAQLRLAAERNLPVELHLRDADNDPSAAAHADAARVLSEEGVPSAGCDIHCFTCGPDVMQPFVDLGCHIAFGGAATFRRSEDIRVAVGTCPDGLIISETDAPYMAPVPLRGQECEPAMVAFTASLLADVRARAGIATRGEAYRQLWENATSLLGG